MFNLKHSKRMIKAQVLKEMTSKTSGLTKEEILQSDAFHKEVTKRLQEVISKEYESEENQQLLLRLNSLKAPSNRAFFCKADEGLYKYFTSQEIYFMHKNHIVPITKSSFKDFYELLKEPNLFSFIFLKKEAPEKEKGFKYISLKEVDI